MKQFIRIAISNIVTTSVFLFILLYQSPVYAQVARLYTHKHGLKNNECRSVDLDSKGFVWISGSNMIGKFDGSRFQYVPAMSEQGKPLFQTAYGVKEIENDQYLVTSSHGLFLLNARNTEFQRILLNSREDSIYGFATNAVIDYPKENYKLVTTDGFGTYLLNTQNCEIDTVLSSKISHVIHDSFVEYPLIDQHQQLWVTTPSVPLLCIDLKSFKRRSFDYTPEASAIISRSHVHALLETDKGMLIGTTHGLLFYDRQQNQVQSIPGDTPDLYINAIIRTHDNRILIGTDGRGIWEYNTSSSGTGFEPVYGQTAEIDLTYGKVMDMTEDNDGNVIAIFLQKGLVVIPPQNNCFHYHPISPVSNGKNATCVTSMAIDKQENYWVGTDGCGVFTTDGMKLATARPVNNGLHSMLVQDVKIDKHGTVWIGSFGGGVQYWANGRWADDGLSSISQTQVMSMYYDANKDQLLVGTNGSGIISVDIASKTAERYPIPFRYNPWISCVMRDSQQHLWVGTSTGLFSYNEKTQQSDTIDVNGERVCNASAIQQDGDEILIAWDGGLIIYNIKSQKMENLSVEQGFASNFVRSIATTDDYIWLATRTHIVSVDKKTHKVRNFSSFSGYEISEFHRNSFVKPGHGYILFGGDNGIICFTPDLMMNRTTEVKPVYFTNFTSAMQTEKLDADILYAKDIYLANNNGTFTIEFASVELGDPERIHYEYILEGLDEQWHTDVHSPQARYSSIPAGNYTFRVRAYLEDNPTEFTENSIAIHVASPWYATFWAWLVYLLIACAIGYFIYQQVRMRKRQREFLRATAERDRMKEAKLNLFTSITHELRSPLTMIESPLKQLMAEDQNADHQSLYAVMQRNCDRLLGIVKQITDIRKIDAGQLTLKLEEQDYVAYSNHVFEQFKGIATVKDIDFVVEHVESELPMMIDTTHFEKIITNLLSNAFKFTPQGGCVIAKSCVVGNKAELHFFNSGSHFSDEDLQHLWERFYQGSASNESTGSGIGLNLVHELVKLHHGTIEAKNTEEGVEFTLTFPYFNAPRPESNSRNTLLLVDDDAELIEYISSQLKRDYNIITAFSGNSAWKQVLTQRPDVVVTDHHMPDGDGMELCQRIKNNPETDNTAVIMLTGEGDEMLQLHSLHVQVDHYLEKPVNIMMLRSAIQQVLSVRENLRSKVNRAEVSNDLPEIVIENADDKLFGRVNEVIKAHLDNSEFSVQQLSEEVGISRVHLNRKMKERYGVSPNIFIKSFRLKQAANLLANNSVNVSEVAYKVGFSSHSYFTTSFHDYFGMSPKEFVAYYSEEEHREALQKLLE